MAYANGKLPKSALAPITKAVNGEQAFLAKDAAAAFMSMNSESEKKYGVTLRVSSARVAYRTLSAQEYFWDQMVNHGGNLAAKPGTSNHGWGLAVDLATPQMRKIVDQIGAKYGWAKKWSDAPSEWWHIKWKEGVYAGFTGDPTIRRGSTDRENIVRLQVLLRGLNLTGIVSGKYGIWTRRAVRKFQKKHGLPVDGIVGQKTWDALHKASL